MSRKGKLRRAVARMGACAIAALLVGRAGASVTATLSLATSGMILNAGTLNVIHDFTGGATILSENAEVRLEGKSSQARTVEIEQNYLQRVLQRQIDSAGFNINPEALKALAVADRSLVLDSLGVKGWIGSGGDAPVYKPNISITPSAIAAEQDTEHEVLTDSYGSFVKGVAKLGKRPADLASAQWTDLTLSLNGADFLADHGFNYLDILHFYYGSSQQLKLGTVQKPYTLSSPQQVYITSGTKILADFEHDEGILQSAGAPNRFNQNIAATNSSMSLLSFKSPHKGKASEQISIDYDESAKGKPFVYRVFSGVSGGESTRQGNLLLPANGEIGFYLRTKTPNLNAQIAVNDSDHVENSVARHIIADDKWHKYVWVVSNPDNWKGNGASVHGPFSLNSLYLTGKSDATVHIDSVFFNEAPPPGPSDSGNAIIIGNGLSGRGNSGNLGSGTIIVNPVSIGTFDAFGGLTKSGTGNLTLTGSNSFIGNSLSYSVAPWMVNSGTLLLSDPSMAGQYAVLAQASGIPGTVLVPEPAAIGLLIAIPALLHRRRKSDI